MELLVIGLPVWFIFGLIGALIGTMKGRSGCGWFLLCALLGPIGLFLAAIVARKK